MGGGGIRTIIYFGGLKFTLGIIIASFVGTALATPRIQYSDASADRQSNELTSLIEPAIFKNDLSIKF